MGRFSGEKVHGESHAGRVREQPNRERTNMFHNPTTDPLSESSEDLSPPATDSLTPSPYYLVRSNLPGLCFEIENPDTKPPVVSFNFTGDDD